MKIKTALLLSLCCVMLASCAEKSPEDSSVTSKADNKSAVTTTAKEEPAPENETETSDGAYTLIDEPVVFDTESGFFDSDIELGLSAADGYEIRYTTDGSEPTKSSELYTAPLKLSDPTENPNVLASMRGTSADGDYIPHGNVKKCNVIRAAVFDDNGGRGPICGGTYFIGIDREKEYSDVPVISLMTDMDNLFDYETGIYVLGKTHDEWLAEDPANGRMDGWKQKGNYSNRGREWERPVYVEFLSPDGSVGFTQDMGVRIMGAASRNSTQKSLRLTARKEYGAKSVEYEIIPDNLRSDGQGNVTEYKSFVLRNGGNDCNYAKVRDPYLQSMVSDKSFETLQATPCVVYLDGEYWGMYTITEDYNDNYIENNYEIDKDNVVIIKCGELEEGQEEDYELYSQMYDFITGNDMTDPDNYAKAAELLDLECFVDYCAFNMYINNEDSIFEQNNWRMWRVREPVEGVEKADGIWRMMVYDVDFSTGIYSGGSSFNDNNINKAFKKQTDLDPDELPPADIFRSLYENEEFKGMLVNALCDMRNITFEKTHALSELRKWSTAYSKLVPPTFRRFGPNYANFQGGISSIQTFLDGRYDVFMYSITDCLKPGARADVTVKAVDESQGRVVLNRSTLDLSKDFTGKYYKEYPIKLIAVPADGHRFVRWEAEGCTISSETEPVVTVSFDEDCRITPVFE